MTADPAVEYHQRQAEGWDERYRAGGFRRRAERFRAEMLPVLAPAGRWLDAGCGSGYFARMLAAAGAEVTGVDAAAAMIAAAEARAEGLAGLAFERIATIEDLPFEDGRFDGLISLSVLEYVPDPARALGECARVLRPGARALVSIPNARSPVRLAARAVQRLARRTAGGTAYLESSHFALARPAIRPWFARQGLDVARIWGVDPVLPGALGRLAPSLHYVLATRR